MRIDAEEKAACAREKFLEGYNCSQAVFAAFAPEMGMDEALALRVASGMGAGMGGLRLTCGAVSAMAMILGALQGYDDPKELEGKKRLYDRVQRLHERFLQTYQTSNCRELLTSAAVAAKSEPSQRTPEYYKIRPCARYVEACARLVAEEWNEGE